MSDYIPGDVITEILSRVPAEDVVRFTLVCKKWYSLIKTPIFISHHLKLSLADKHRHHHPLLSYKHYDYDDDIEDRVSLLMDDDDDSTFRDYKRYTIPRPLSQNSEIWDYDIVGSSNGLICLDCTGDKNKKVIFIWNPVINKALPVPWPRISHFTQLGAKHSLGFGYDSLNNDYKIVRISYPDFKVRNPEETCGVQVYSLNEGFWRRVSDQTPPPYAAVETVHHQAYVHGSVHWIVYDKRGREYLIAVFGMQDEIYREMPVPESVLYDHTILGTNKVNLQVYQESISLFYQHLTPGYGFFCTVWVMREYGVPQSWARLFQVDLQALVLVNPIGLRSNGELLFPSLDGDVELVSYDCEKNVVSHLKYSMHGADRQSLFYVGAYTNSLVLLDKGEDFHNLVTKEIKLVEKRDVEEEKEKVDCS